MNKSERRKELAARIEDLRTSRGEIDLAKASVEEMEQWIEERKRRISKRQQTKKVEGLKRIASYLKTDLPTIETDTASTEEIAAWIVRAEGEIALAQKAEGMKLGEQKYRHDLALGIYPLRGLPIDRTDRVNEWIDGYQSSYYQDLKHDKPELLQSDRIDITVGVSKQLLDAATLAGICSTEAIEKGFVDLLSLCHSLEDY